MWDYDKISAALWVEETLQSAEYVSQSNESYENFRDSTDTSNIEWKQQAEEKFWKDFVENQLTEWLSSIAFKEWFQNFKDILWDNINYVSNFSDMENFSLEDGMSLKMNVKWTEFDLGFAWGNATITDYLPDGKTFEWKEKSLSISWNMITPNQLKDRLSSEINISDIAKNSSDKNDFNQNLQKTLEEKSQEILSSQKTDLSKADLDYEIERAEKYTQILDFYQPPWSFDNFLDKQEPKETISSSSWAKYEFLDVVRNTINNNSISDVEYIANWFEQIKNYEPRDGDRQIVKDLVDDFDNRDTSSFMNFINEFTKTDELWNKVLDMEQFQNFVESLNDIGKNYERENYRPDAHVDKISQIRREEEKQRREENPEEILKEKEDLFV